MKNYYKQIKSWVKEIIFFFLNLLPAPKGLPILMYHSVGYNPVFFSVKPEIFEKQMRYLADNGYRTIFMSEAIEILQKGEIPSKTIAITFDDGYKDFYTAAFPILKKFRLRSTMYVATGFIGQRMDNSAGHPLETMGWEEIGELHANGLVEFEPHSHTHPKLTEILLEKLLEEIQESKRIIESNLNKKSVTFSYPKGYYNQEVIEATHNSGFEGAVTVKEGVNTSGTSLLELTRNSIDSMTGWLHFKAKLSGKILLFRKLWRS